MVKHLCPKSGEIRQNPVKRICIENPLTPPKNKEDACIYIPSPSPFDVIRSDFERRGRIVSGYGGCGSFGFIAGKTFCKKLSYTAAELSVASASFETAACAAAAAAATARVRRATRRSSSCSSAAMPMEVE